MNKKVYISAALLVFLSLGLMQARIYYGGQDVRPDFDRYHWRVQITMNIEGRGGERGSIRLTLPKETAHQRIYNENFESDQMIFYIRDSRTGNRLGYWKEEILDGVRIIRYNFSCQLKTIQYAIPDNITLPKDPFKAYPSELHKTLTPSKFIQSDHPNIQKRLKKIYGREKRISIVMKKLYDFVLGEVQYKSEKGSKDAIDTLKQLEADCGGKARLLAAFSRAAGIPSRVVGGLVLERGVKNITHAWVENYINGEWIPFDVVNNYYAKLPAHYLELHQGDYSLIRYSGLKKMDYFFSIGKENLPPVDQPWSLYALPVHFYDLIRVLLLIPIGALVVALIRVVIGIPTLGTFTPVLIALAFRKVSPWAGVACITIIVAMGWLLRKGLDALKILIIPRLAIIISCVVMSVLAVIMVSYHMGQRQMLYVTLFPIVIMTWTIERFSLLQIEDGSEAAFKGILGTGVIAAIAYFLMEIQALDTYLFTFPESLLIVMAALLVLGRYTGIRVTEIKRFRELAKLQKLQKEKSASV